MEENKKKFGERWKRSWSRHSNQKFLKIPSACKNLDDQVRFGRPKTINSEAVLQAIEANQSSSTQEYQASLASHKPVWFAILVTSAKVSRASKLCLILPKYCKTFGSLFCSIGIKIVSAMDEGCLFSAHKSIFVWSLISVIHLFCKKIKKWKGFCF